LMEYHSKAFAHFALISKRFAIIFLQIQVEWSEGQLEDYYKKYSSTESKLMSFVHFSSFLSSTKNSIVKKSKYALHQDMTRPLNEYLIYSSHNTYLLGDQLRSESSIEGYIRALQRGCRCVECKFIRQSNFSGLLGWFKWTANNISWDDSVITMKSLISGPAKYFFGM
jgi:hypothetical protein